MKKCEVCGKEEEMENAEKQFGFSQLHICDTCQDDRKFSLAAEILQ
jgi:hypothetical protein